MKNCNKEILLIFKTHLDIGFTDYSENVLKRYLNEYIPNAIKVGNELKGTKTPFVWTLGSWLVWQALKNDENGIVEKTIKDGILRWHALPFTTHTELMNKELFESGISLSKKLDERFGIKTIGAKMTDVPGHTIGMVSLLKKHGVNFLHLGVNPATPLPNVPPIFKWKNGEDSIIVMYQGDYGEVAEFDDFIVYFAHTGDNLGPQTPEVIVDVYNQLAEKYPDCVIKPATIDDLAVRIQKVENLPILEKEIGDTWIHGAGTDPQKLSRYRKLLRKLKEVDFLNFDFSDDLLCVPEHTWGMDIKTHFPFDKYYTHQEMENLEAERAKIEKSWQEQRNYVSNAEKKLGVISDYLVVEPDVSEYEEVEHLEVLDFELSWQIFDNSDYERYKDTYMRSHAGWAIWDFTKVGLHEYKGGIYIPNVVKSYKKGEELLFRLEFNEDIANSYGLPYFFVQKKDDFVKVSWFGKKCSRLPQACWLKFKGMNENWQVEKMGQWINPCDIIGSPLICGIDSGIKNDSLIIESLDCGLVAPFGRKLLYYDFENCKQDMYFNLYNNIWNTNFPMWYTDDAMFRFKIKKHIK